MDDPENLSDSESSIDEQELECALYSQIHFEAQNDAGCVSEGRNEDNLSYKSNSSFFCLGLEDVPPCYSKSKSDKAQSESGLTLEEQNNATKDLVIEEKVHDHIPLVKKKSGTKNRTSGSEDFIGFSQKIKENNSSSKRHKAESFISIPQEYTQKKKATPQIKQEVAVKPRAPPVRLRGPVRVNVSYKQDSDTNTDYSDSDVSSVLSSPEKRKVSKAKKANSMKENSKSSPPKSKKSVEVINFSDQLKVTNDPIPAKDMGKQLLMFKIDVGKRTKNKEDSSNISLDNNFSSDSDDNSKNENVDEEVLAPQVPDINDVTDEKLGESSSDDNDSSENDMDILEPDSKLDFNLDGGMASLLKMKMSPKNVNAGKWHIEDKDRYNVSTTMSRYFCERKIQCRNCHEEGHMSRDCPEPLKQRCVFCAGTGHMYQTCPMSVCHNCQAPGHKSKDCPEPRQNRYKECGRCWMRGHHHTVCPDRWRQYHLTIHSGGHIQAPKNISHNPLVFCYNCGQKGHLGYECQQDRMNRFVSANYPFVAEYDKSHTKSSEKRRSKEESVHAKDAGKKRKRSRGISSKAETESHHPKKWKNRKGGTHPVETSGEWEVKSSEVPRFDPYGSQSCDRLDQDTNEWNRSHLRHNHKRAGQFPRAAGSWTARHSRECDSAPLFSLNKGLSSFGFQDFSSHEHEVHSAPSRQHSSEMPNHRLHYSHNRQQSPSRFQGRDSSHHRANKGGRDDFPFFSDNRSRFMMVDPQGDRMWEPVDHAGFRQDSHRGFAEPCSRAQDHEFSDPGMERLRKDQLSGNWNRRHKSIKGKKKDKSSSRKTGKKNPSTSHNKHVPATSRKTSQSRRHNSSVSGFQSTNEMFWDSRKRPASKEWKSRKRIKR